MVIANEIFLVNINIFSIKSVNKSNGDDNEVTRKSTKMIMKQEKKKSLSYHEICL